MNWVLEVEELHAFFGSWFSGAIEGLTRVERVLDPAFTLVSPDGEEISRDTILTTLRNSPGTDPELRIWTTHHESIHAGPDHVIASYREHHEGGHRGPTSRISTAVFLRDAAAPQGVRWLRVHETWIHPD